MPVNKVYVGSSIQEAFDRLVDQINAALRDRTVDVGEIEARLRRFRRDIEGQIRRAAITAPPPLLEKPTAEIPGPYNLQAAVKEVDTENRVVVVTIIGLAPDVHDLAQVRVYVEAPKSDDPDPENPTLPGVVRYLRPFYVLRNQTFVVDVEVPFPDEAWLADRYNQTPSNQGLRVKWVFYVIPETWTACAPLRRLTSFDPPLPENVSPWVAVVVDLTDAGARAAVGHLGPAIEGVEVAVDSSTGLAAIRINFNAIYPSLNLDGVWLYTSTQQDPEWRPHGRWPYIPPGPSRAVATLPIPTAPTVVACLLQGEWADGYRRPIQPLTWGSDGQPVDLPSWGVTVTLTPETVGLGYVVIDSAAVEFRQLEGGWSYRFVVSLSGDAISSPVYAGTAIYVRMSDDPEPQSASDWLTLRQVAEHRRGEPTTVYSPWYPIVPGTQRQYWMRPLIRPSDGSSSVWGTVVGPYTLNLPRTDAIPGLEHNWGFSAQLNGYWDDGNGVRYGRIDVSWNPLPQSGIVYGIYEFRSPDADPPLYEAFRPTDANTVESSVTLWVPPPVGDGEYLHLALVAQLPAEGVWPRPVDYPAGKLPVATVWLPKAGLSDHVTDWQVTVETDQTQDVPRGRFVFSFTPPADPDFHHVHVYRRPANAQGDPIADWLPDKVASIMTGGPGGWWPLPSQPEYWLFKAVACNSLGQENDDGAPIVFVEVPTSDGVTASRVTPGAVTGPISVDGQGRITIFNGAITADHIASVSAGAIVGTITADKIESISADQIVGTITADRIGSIPANKITGKLQASQIESVAANQISGVLQAGQIASINASQIEGVIVTQQLADQILNSARLLGDQLRVPVRVASLPQLPNPDWPPGSLALLTSDNTLWKNQNGSWVQVSASTELTGMIRSSDIVSISASKITGLITAGQIDMIEAGQINGLIQSNQIQSIHGSKIEVGSISSDKIALIEGSKIEVGSISGDRIQIGAITGSHISIGAITGEKIAAGSITAEKIAAGAITAEKIAAGAITAEKIAADAITATNIVAGTITADKINTVNASSIVSGVGNEVSGDFWVSGKIRVGNGIDVVGNVSLQNGTVYATTLQAPTINALTTLNVGGNEVKNAAFCEVGSGSGKVASGTHTHSITVTLSVTKQTIWYRDADDNWYAVDVVTDVTVAGVSCGQPS